MENNHLKVIIITIILMTKISGISNAQILAGMTNQALEWEYISAKEYNDPFNEIEISAFINNNVHEELIILPGYWAGGSKWKFRFSASTPGEYRFHIKCTDPSNISLHNKKGRIVIKENNTENPLYKHGTLKLSANKRYLEHLDGTPFLWLADSWWHGMTKRFKWPEDFQQLTLDRKEKGFNVIQFTIGFPCDIEPFDARGQNEAGDPWDPQMQSINPYYFDLVDHRMQYLIEQGMLPNILGSWGYYIKWLGVEKMKKHWRYLIARYGAYPVIWTLAGESTLAWYPDLSTRWEEEKAIFRDQWSEVAEYIKKTDPYHRLLTVHPGPNSGDFKPIDKMEYIDFIMLQSGHSGFFTIPKAYEAVEKARDLYPDKPVMHGEVCFEGMHGSSRDDVQRILFWNNMLSGTCGFSYGVEGIWQFNTEEELFGMSPGGNTWGNVPWEIAYNYAGSNQLGIGKRILEQYNWQHLQPRQDLIEATSKDAFGPICAASPDDTRFIYFFQPPARWRPYTVTELNQTKIYQVTFYDPITGNKYNYDPITPDPSGKWNIPSVPISQDWVVVIQPAD